MTGEEFAATSLSDVPLPENGQFGGPRSSGVRNTSKKMCCVTVMENAVTALKTEPLMSTLE